MTQVVKAYEPDATPNPLEHVEGLDLLPMDRPATAPSPVGETFTDPETGEPRHVLPADYKGIAPRDKEL